MWKGNELTTTTTREKKREKEDVQNEEGKIEEARHETGDNNHIQRRKDVGRK